MTGSAGASPRKHAREDFKKRPYAQQIWYTHSRTKAETSLREAADTLLEENRTKNDGPNSVSQTFVGTDGIMMKNTTMDAAKLYDILDGEGTILDTSSYAGIARDEMVEDEEVKLPKIQCIVATKSAEAGINGKFLEFGKMNGIPSSKYELVQALGRVDREGKAEPGSNTYQIHADAYSHTSQFVRIMKCPSRSERAIQMTDLNEVMVMLFCPKCATTKQLKYILSGRKTRRRKTAKNIVQSASKRSANKREKAQVSRNGCVRQVCNHSCVERSTDKRLR